MQFLNGNKNRLPYTMNVYFNIVKNCCNIAHFSKVDVDSTRSSRLSHVILDARHGGPIATQTAEH